MLWLEGQATPPGDEAEFRYGLPLGEPIDVIVRPVPDIYPEADNLDHMNIPQQLQGDANVQYSSTCPTNSMMPRLSGQELRIGSSGINSTGHIGRVEIDMPDLGNWNDDPYGHRYWFEIGSRNVGDLVRFAITPINTTFSHDPGVDTAIWIEQEHTQNPAPNLRLFIRHAGATDQYGPYQSNPFYGKGILLSGNRLQLFDWHRIPITGLGTFTSKESPIDVHEDILSVFTNAADLRVTLEVESRSETSAHNSFSWLRVQPAYEYEVELTWYRRGETDSVTEIATFVHWRELHDGYGGADVTAITYDTHGTGRR